LTDVSSSREQDHGLRALVLRALCGSVAALASVSAGAQSFEDVVLQAPAAEPGDVHPPSPGSKLPTWLNPDTAPFIPVPVIAADPDSGTTLGFLAAKVRTDANRNIDRIIAPDLVHNPYFGIGAHMRLYEYPSEDERWSVLANYFQRVQRGADAEFQTGRERQGPWSFSGSLIYDRNGTPRFYGVGNESPSFDATDYTAVEKLAQVQVGYNFNPTWQLLYTLREEQVEVLPGTLEGIASIETRFAQLLGLGTNSVLLNRLAIVYDTRDDQTVPSKGMEWVTYGGFASRSGFSDSLDTEAGVDGRGFWSLPWSTTLAGHVALRYLLTEHLLPFWALSSIGGEDSVIGGEQPLRGFGAGRFYDRDSFSSSIELRHNVFSFDASTRVDIELAPFIDVGRVFARTSTFPLSQLHTVVGVGFRGIARPSVVGFVDLGYGSEGAAVFTGINYPF
jgi:hypothetical protein